MTTIIGMAGTATEVGKTWVGAALMAELRDRGLRVSARKPLQSHDPAEDGPLDAEVLAAATGEYPAVVCLATATFPVPMAPPMAADVLGVARPTTADVVAVAGRHRWPADIDVALVETVGGVASPMTADAHSAAILDAVGVDVVVLVADAGLGTIDAVRTARSVLGHEIATIVFLNRYDDAIDLHRRNRVWLTDDGHDIVVEVAVLADRFRRA